MSNIWKELGFRDNPFSTQPIPANEEGRELLIGRDKELKQLRTLLSSSENHATIEGANGVGKTSLVGVASYTLYKDFLDDPEENPMFLPMDDVFQMSATDTPEAFSEKFLLKLCSFIAGLKNLNPDIFPYDKLQELQKWTNNPILHAHAGGFSLGGYGLNVANAATVNTSPGFLKAGLESHLRDIMKNIFPNKLSGGIVCILDNLELLDTSSLARKTLEGLRDGVLSFPGIKWVLCGAKGILRSVVSTPRLQGKLSRPIELEPLPSQHIQEVIQKRISILKTRDDAYTPVDVDGFKKLYEITNKNLRISLKYCEDFVMWCSFEDKNPKTKEERLTSLEKWLEEEAARASDGTKNVKPTAWKVFETIGDKSEGISPTGDFADFGYDNPQALQPHLRTLEQATLIESTMDETDKRRKTITLTPRGWIVRYHKQRQKADSKA